MYRRKCKSTEFSILMWKEMSVNLTENDLVIFCQQILKFLYTFYFYSVYFETLAWISQRGSHFLYYLYGW